MNPLTFSTCQRNGLMPMPELRGLAIAAVLIGAPVHGADVGRFPPGQGEPPAPWRVLRLGEKLTPTRYQLREWDGVRAVEAQANASMALLARPLAVDLTQTPVLCWRWRVDAPLKSADLRTRAGDDYAARIYITFALKPEALDFGTRTRLRLGRAIFGPDLPDAAINYVWDNRYPVGTRVPNAYTDRARLIVTRSGAADAGRWVEERRDVLADAEQEFGPHIAAAQQLALASDTDNTGESARAGFADLHFVARGARCVF